MHRLFALSLILGAGACSFDFDSFKVGDAATATEPTPVDGAASETSAPSGDGGPTVDSPNEDAPLPSDGATPDASPPEDAGTDTAPTDSSATDTEVPDTAIEDTGTDSGPCIPSSACLSTAQNCAKDCKDTATACIAACGPPKCKTACQTTEAQCLVACASSCTACTQTAGCSAPADCNAAVN
jgi:hypothetical protein